MAADMKTDEQRAKDDDKARAEIDERDKKIAAMEAKLAALEEERNRIAGAASSSVRSGTITANAKNEPNR